MFYELDHFVTKRPNIRVLEGKGCRFFWTREVIVWMDKGGTEHTVPMGFVSDGYSVPPYLWGLVRGVSSTKEAIAHDYGYLTQPVAKYILDRNIASGLRKAGAPRWTSYKVHLGLWLGGSKVWSRNEQDLEDFGYQKVLNAQVAETLKEAQAIAARGKR